MSSARFQWSSKAHKKRLIFEWSEKRDFYGLIKYETLHRFDDRDLVIMVRFEKYFRCDFLETYGSDTDVIHLWNIQNLVMNGLTVEDLHAKFVLGNAILKRDQAY